VQQLGDSALDLVDDGPHFVDVVVGGVGEVPVEVGLAGVDGAGVAAARGDEDVGGAGGFVGEGCSAAKRSVSSGR
jgi:hypothetical protein